MAATWAVGNLAAGWMLGTLLVHQWEHPDALVPIAASAADTPAPPD